MEKSNKKIGDGIKPNKYKGMSSNIEEVSPIIIPDYKLIGVAKKAERVSEYAHVWQHRGDGEFYCIKCNRWKEEDELITKPTNCIIN